LYQRMVLPHYADSLRSVRVRDELNHWVIWITGGTRFFKRQCSRDHRLLSLVIIKFSHPQAEQHTVELGGDVVCTKCAQVVSY